MSEAEQIFKRYASIIERVKGKIDVDESDMVSFNPPATDEEIKKLEEMVGKTLPEEFRDFYLIHNGSNETACLHGEEWIGVDTIIDEWQCWKGLVDDFDDTGVDAAAGIFPKWWNVLWVPISRSGAGDSYCIDLDPDVKNGGKYGQVIRMWHDSPERTLEASSLLEFFEMFIDDIENGHVVYDDDFFGFVPKDEASGNVARLFPDGTTKYYESGMPFSDDDDQGYDADDEDDEEVVSDTPED